MNFKKSQDYLQRALKTVPLGSQTFSKSHQQFPEGASPLFVERGEGGRVWDVDGNEYVDLICGLLPIVLGYKDPDIDQAVKNQLDKGISFSLATELEFQLAERLVEVIPCAEMVRFGKNGTDATSAAVRLARAFTGKEQIIALGYHGWQDWYIGATVRNLGIPKSTCALTTKVPYNNLEALKEAFGKFKGNVAAVIMEPMNTIDPAPGYLEAVKQIAHDHGALVILDEIITGFRFALGGAQEYFDFTPDLATFGKAMGNGMPVSAVVGRADVMTLMNDIFYSSTFAGETLSLAAAIAVIDKMKREPVIDKLWQTGEAMCEGARTRIKKHGLENHIMLAGKAPWMILQFADHDHGSKEAIKTLFLKEMIAHGVLMAVSHNICYAHNDMDVARVLKAYDAALPRVKDALQKEHLDDHINMPLIKPVFSVR